RACDGVDVVDRGRRGVQARGRGERRLEPGLPTTSFEGVEQRRLLTADVRARSRVDGDLEIEARAEDVLAEVARSFGFAHGRVETADAVQCLAADVDEAVVGPHRV